MKLGKSLVDGTILFVSVYAGIKGYQLFSKEYEKVVPSSIDKVHMIGLVASMNKDNKDD